VAPEGRILDKRRRILWGAFFSLALLESASYAGGGRSYVSGQAGMFLPLESAVTLEPAGLQGRLTYNPGFVLTAAGGYEFGNGLRGEAELNFRRLTADKLYSSGAPVQVDAGIQSYGAMANAYYDLRTPTAVTPFLGAGLGFAVARYGRGTSGGSTLWAAGQDSSLAYQGCAGFAIALNDRTSLDFIYRHYATPSLHFDTIRSQYKGINLSTGVRYRF
jgi:opacity protein-like surface antigen